MLIRKSLAKINYVKVDNKVWTDRNLSNGAVRLYGYLASLRTGQEFVDKYILKALDISQRVLTNRKKELKESGLILSDRTGAKSYILYIGSSEYPANKVKENWDKLDAGEGVINE